MQTSRTLLLASFAAVAGACSVAKTSSTGAGVCTQCHGDPNRVAPDPIVAAAPPKGTNGSTDPSDLLVGAHQKHLAGGDGTRLYSLGFACTECHAVPSLAGHPSGTIEFDFSGGIATQTVVDVATGKCSNVYCHDPGNTGRPGPTWNAPGSVTCGSCHDLPPPPSTNHPSVSSALTGCATCHPNTMNADGTLNVAGGYHVNGVFDAAGAHPAGFENPTNAAFHGPTAIKFLQGDTTVLQCTSCHGADLTGGAGPSCGGCHSNPPTALQPYLDPAFQNGVDWTTNCTFCHGTPSTDANATVLLAAPPRDVAGQTTGTKVGAHQTHLVTTAVSKPFACQTCHAVPTGFTIPPATSAHLDDTALVTPQGSGQASLPSSLGTYSSASGTCAVYCHGGAAGGPTGGKIPQPAWSGTSITACDACHGNAIGGAPNDFYPNTGQHDFHVSSLGVRCYICHNSVVSNVSTSSAPAIVDTSLHVNGAKDVSFGGSWNSQTISGTWDGASCTVTCHGTRSW